MHSVMSRHEEIQFDTPTSSSSQSYCNAPAKYLAYVAWPGKTAADEKHRKCLMQSVEASWAQSIGLPPRDRREGIRTVRLDRAEAKVTDAIRRLIEIRFAAFRMAVFQIYEGNSLSATVANVSDGKLWPLFHGWEEANIRKRVWVSSIPALPLIFGLAAVLRLGKELNFSICDILGNHGLVSRYDWIETATKEAQSMLPDLERIQAEKMYVPRVFNRIVEPAITTK